MDNCVDCFQRTELDYYCERCRRDYKLEKFPDETVEKIAKLWRMAGKQKYGVCDKKAQVRAVKLLARIGAVGVLKRIFNTEVKTVRGADYEDTWGSEHKGGYNYVGIHPETKKLAKEKMDELLK